MGAHASINRIFRLVWNEALGAWVAVAENARGRGKGGTRSLARRSACMLAIGFGAAGAAHAAASSGVAPVMRMTVPLGTVSPARSTVPAVTAPPTTELPIGGKVVAGSASISPGLGMPGTAVLDIDQTTQRAAIDWLSFNVGSAAQVNFHQPDAGSSTLNRVLDSNPSRIFGKITANGQVFLTNPNGVYFGKSGSVDVGGLTATSSGIADADFMAGKTTFVRNGSTGSVVNEGTLRAGIGGYVALLAPEVRNGGVIVAQLGTVAMAAGDAVTLSFDGNHLAGITVQPSAIRALVQNRGAVLAPGGTIILSARALDKLQGGVVRNTGTLEATGLSSKEGRIVLEASDTVEVGGLLDASSTIGNGGAIVVTGRDVALGHGATLDASGATGGGSIKVGGGFHGADPDVANASSVRVNAGVTARADATGQGDGGTIVFWSDDATRFAGTLSARGGPTGGDGGSIEVSGKQDLSYSGRADARAPLGRTGNLLLDPATLTLSGGGTGSGAITGTTVYEKDLEAQNANVLLQATGNVTIGDLNLNGGDGTVSMANNVSLRVEGGTTGNGNITFTNAANTIEVFGTGSLLFVAGSTGSGVITNAPNLIAHGTGTNPGTLPTHTVTSVGSGTPGAASITLFGADGVTVGASVTTNGGYVRVWADSDNAGGGGYTMSAPVVTNGGNFYVSAGTGTILLNSSMTLGTGRILFKADGSYTSGQRTLGGLLSASGAIDVNTPFVMNAGAGILTDGVITFSNTVNLNTGAGALTLRASAIDFTAATLSNLSTASLILQPADPSTSMVLGAPTGFASATTLAKLPGVKNLTVGRTDGTGTTSVASDFSFAATGVLEVVNRTIDITGGKLTNTSGNVTLTGDNVNISQQITSNAGAGSVTLRQLTAANPINLGSGLTNAVIGQINAATLVIGRSDGGNVTFDSDIATTASSVHLLSGGRVIGTAGGVSAANLAINAAGGATISSPTFNFSKLALAVGGSTSITQTNAGFDIGAVDGVAGLAINTGSNASVTLQGQGAISASGALALNGNTSTVTINASSVNLASSTVGGATNASFALRPLNAGDNLAIGAAGGFATSATLAKLTNSKNVTVGRSDGTGLSTVSAAVSLAASGTFELVNGQVLLGAGSVTNSGGGVKLNALAGDLTLNGNVTASGQLTLSGTSAGNVTGSGNLSASSLLIDAAPATVALNAAGNAVGTIAGNVASLSFVDASALAVGTVGAVSGIHSTGGVLLRTTGATADLTLNQAVSGRAGGDAVVLASARNFINNDGASAIDVSGGGRWLVYSGSPLSDIRGGLTYAFKQYDASYGDAVLGSGNGFLHRVAPVVTIGLAGNVSKVYDGDATATLAAGNYSTGGTIDGDAVSFTSTGASYASKDVGTGKGVSAGGLSLTGAGNAGATVYGYRLSSGTAAANIGLITPATLSVGTAIVADKVYDATPTASVSGVGLTGVIGSDAVGTRASGTFPDKNVGNARTVTVGGIVLTGADAGNYVLDTTSASGTASIIPAPLTVGAATIADKVYDATSVASVVSVGLTGVFGSDAIGTTATGAFANKNVGNGKAVTVGGIVLTGADAGNYFLASTSSTGTASITPAPLTVGIATIADKVYDATTVATVGAVALAGVIGGDAVGTTASASFVDKNVGHGKAVAVGGIALTGADAGNYVLDTTSASATASITPAILTVGFATGADKVYDATSAATVALTGNALAGDTLALGYGSASFADKNVGTAKTVTVGGIALSGADAGNYTVASVATTAADITPATITQVTGISAASKVYDGTTSATLAPGPLGFVGMLAGDSLTASASRVAFVDKNAGVGKGVTIGGLALGGTDAGNYVLAQQSGTSTATITPATLVVTAIAASKVYDTTTAATVSLAGNAIAGDSVGVSYAGAAFADKNAGVGKVVTVGGIGLSGADAGNYVVGPATTTTGDIAKATLVVSASGVNKVYDATTGAAVTVSGTPLGSDVVNVGYASASFADKNAGVGKTVSVVGIDLSGADAGNYRPSATVTATADIAPASLTVGATGLAKLYDGTSRAAVTLTDNRFAGDQISLAATNVTFSDANAGKAKAIAVVGIHMIGGADQGNYVLANTTASTASDVTAFTDSWSVPPIPAPTIVPPTATAPASLLDLTPPSGALRASGGIDGIGTAGPSVGTGTAGVASASGRSAAVGEGDGAQAGITVSLVHSSSAQRTGLIAVLVPVETVSSGKGFSFALPDEMFAEAGDPAPRVTLANGSDLPAWLGYEARSKVFTARAAPAGALPIDVLVRVGKRSWTVAVAERPRS